MRRAFVMLLMITSLMVMVWGQVTVVMGQQANSQKNDRFLANSIEPDGFLGLRLGNSFRFAEDILGDADVVRNGSMEWHFRDADYDPYEALTILGDKRKIDGFVAHLRGNRIQFTDMKVYPKQNRLGTYNASKRYRLGKYDVVITAVGDDATFVRRIVLQAKEAE